MSEQPTFSSFEEFWDYYVSVHSHPVNRALHVGGTLAGFALAGSAILFRKRWPLVLAPIVGYGCSWIGHFFIEKNTPATFTHPVWSFRGDMKMISMTLRGTMQAELDRVMAAKKAAEAKAPSEAAPTSTATPANDSARKPATNAN